MRNNKINLPEGKNIIPPKLIFFTSFEEQKKYEDDYTNNQDPVERLRQTVKLIKKIYNVKHSEIKSIKKINFIRTS